MAVVLLRFPCTLLSPCTPTVPPWLPLMQTVELELGFAGSMSGNCLHLPVCNNSDVPHAPSAYRSHDSAAHRMERGGGLRALHEVQARGRGGGVRALAAMAQGSALPHGALHGCETLNAPGGRAFFWAC